MNDSSDPVINVFDLIDNYRVIKPIGDGGFGNVYFVRDESTNRAYAMKIAKNQANNQVVDLERDVMEEITGNSCFPFVIKSGCYHKFNYIIMELLGTSLATMRKLSEGKKFTLYTALMVASQTINILEIFHNKGFVHRDVKSSNFLIKQKNPSELCLIDFGLSKRYIDPNTGKPHPKLDRVHFVGTPRYASIRALQNYDVGVVDDLISWFYMVIELSLGHLPWSSLVDRELILAMKLRTPIEQICIGLPSQMINIYKYLEKLTYDDTVDYAFIHAQLFDAIKTLNESNVKELDWVHMPSLTASVCGTPVRRLLSDSLEGRSPEQVDVENSPPKLQPQKSVGRGLERILLPCEDTEQILTNEPFPLSEDDEEQGCCGWICYTWRRLFRQKH